ncbi:hypothetical protein SKAU_G00310100 [Synaphobranchus kaupii]|uniref:Uncharacterized protein n=1 Tax=Synaphobranchus kaupii TaxID=118154 RepID=A0A9Q1ERJ1_SYNKA|nr:hypothetical protein SKAU_G00310100 [Synaphobranchus kaupii]
MALRLGLPATRAHAFPRVHKVAHGAIGPLQQNPKGLVPQTAPVYPSKRVALRFIRMDVRRPARHSMRLKQ